MLSFIAAAPINHVLRGESWALRRLQTHAGLTARVDAFPFFGSFTVRDDGELIAAIPGATPALTIQVTPPVAMRILAGDESAYAEVSVSGDADFAQSVEFVVRNARWDFEEDLARVLGDTAAHRLAQTGRRLFAIPPRVAGSFVRNAADYWLEERPLIARRTDVAEYVRDVDALRDDVERLAQRIARIGPS